MRQDSPFFMMIKCYTDADHYEKRRIFYMDKGRMIYVDESGKKHLVE